MKVASFIFGILFEELQQSDIQIMQISNTCHRERRLHIELREPRLVILFHKSAIMDVNECETEFLEHSDWE